MPRLVGECAHVAGIQGESGWHHSSHVGRGVETTHVRAIYFQQAQPLSHIQRRGPSLVTSASNEIKHISASELIWETCHSLLAFQHAQTSNVFNVCQSNNDLLLDSTITLAWPQTKCTTMHHTLHMLKVRLSYGLASRNSPMEITFNM